MRIFKMPLVILLIFLLLLSLFIFVSYISHKIQLKKDSKLLKSTRKGLK